MAACSKPGVYTICAGCFNFMFIISLMLLRLALGPKNRLYKLCISTQTKDYCTHTHTHRSQYTVLWKRRRITKFRAHTFYRYVHQICQVNESRSKVKKAKNKTRIQAAISTQAFRPYIYILFLVLVLHGRWHAHLLCVRVYVCVLETSAPTGSCALL